MPLSNFKKLLAPIKIKQTTLYKFCPHLPEPRKRDLLVEMEKHETKPSSNGYNLSLEGDNVIEIQESHCLACGRRLVKNGFNRRIVILDLGLGKFHFRLHRKRCKTCGEITPDYSMLAARHGNYHENYKRKARQHYMEGLMLPQIQRAFKVDLNIEISKSSVVNWINEVAAPLREALSESPVPSSGYWGYDEIHLSLCGKRTYAISIIDLQTRFIQNIRFSPHMGRNAGRLVLLEARRGKGPWLTALVKDCTTNLGGLFKTRSFKHVKLQNCLTHVKWIISAHVKSFAGLSRRSKKSVPQEWRWVLQRFYDLLDSTNETNAFIALEILRYMVEITTKKRKKQLETAFKQLESWLPKIIAHQRDPNISRTNNLLESCHEKFIYYPSFKRRMKTPEGVQRVLDYRAFGHNLRQFPRYIARVQARSKEIAQFLRESRDTAQLGGHGTHVKFKLKHANECFENYMHLWNQYFAKI